MSKEIQKPHAEKKAEHPPASKAPAPAPPAKAPEPTKPEPEPPVVASAPPAPEPQAEPAAPPTEPLVSVELTTEQKRQQYLDATREYCAAEADLKAIIAADGERLAAAKERLRKAEARRVLVERFAETVSSAEVAAITNSGIWGR